mmetsp:Transcript_29335/g.60129  ORF Transcript_29335/g.60129 Transcript_29335/m.60129 type:complete len:240 (+) Transcript_29335:1002-1721(+)
MHGRLAHQPFVHRLRWNITGYMANPQFNFTVPVARHAHFAAGQQLAVLLAMAGQGKPVGRLEHKVPGLGHAHLGRPHLREVPGQQGVDKHVRDHDAADGADGDAVVGLEESARADLQRQWGKQAADHLSLLVWNRQVSSGSEHGDRNNVESNKQSEGGLATGLRGVEKGRNEEGKGHRGKTESEQQAENTSKVSIVEQPGGGDDGTRKGKDESQDDSIGEEVARVVCHVGQTHHAHGLL